ncbi:MAG: hypothetical protein ACC630_02040 [Nitrospinota bacterium]
MLTSKDLKQVKSFIIKNLPEIIEKDKNLIFWIEGVIAEKFPRRDEFNHLLDELVQLRMDMNKRFEQVDKRFEQADKRFEQLRMDMNKRFEQVDKRFEMMHQDFVDLRKSVNIQVGGFQRRAGRNLEDMVAGTLRLALGMRDIKPENIKLRQKIMDKEGLIGLVGKKYEIDILAVNGKTILFEIKSVPEEEDVERFSEKVKLAREILNSPDADAVMVTLDKPKKLIEICHDFGITLV